MDEPLAWNEVEDLMMEDREILVEDIRPEKRSREEISQVGENGGRKTTSVRKNENIPLVY